MADDLETVENGQMLMQPPLPAMPGISTIPAAALPETHYGGNLVRLPVGNALGRIPGSALRYRFRWQLPKAGRHRQEIQVPRKPSCDCSSHLFWSQRLRKRDLQSFERALELSVLT